MSLYYMGTFTHVIWSTIAWTEKFNNGLCTHFLQLCGLKSSRNSSCLKNHRCELSLSFAIQKSSLHKQLQKSWDLPEHQFKSLSQSSWAACVSNYFKQKQLIFASMSFTKSFTHWTLFQQAHFRSFLPIPQGTNYYFSDFCHT